MVAIMTDTNSGISVKEAETMGIFCMPMPVIIEEDNFFEDVNLSQEEFFEILSKGSDVSTSQPSPGDVQDMWDSILSKGFDSLVYIPMSSGLSNSTESAMLFSQDYDGKVVVIDNHRVSVTQRQSVIDAKFFAEEGKSADEIKGLLEDKEYESVIYLAVDTLEYLKKSGRVNATAATVGNVLGIKPILKTTGEKFDLCTAVRGSKKVYAKVIEEIHHELNTRFKGIAHDDLVIGTAGSFLNLEDAQNWENAVKEEFPDIEVFYDALSCSVSAHTGPNALGVGISIRMCK